MEKTNQYAEIRNQINELEAKAKELEPAVIEELTAAGEKRIDTELGRVVTVETKIFTYSEVLQRKEKATKEKIKDFTDTEMEVVRSAKAIEEKYLTPEVKLSIRFTANKEEK